MSEVTKRYWKLLFYIVFSSLITMSCWVTQTVQRFDCEASGGTWKIHSVYQDYDCINAGPEYTQKYFPQSMENDSINTYESTIQDDSSLSGTGCDATQSLQVSSEITKQETNQYGTRSCEYQLTINNSSNDTGIWVVFYQHDQDGYAHTEKSRWMGKILIEPGGSINWPANVYLYDDPDADGPVMSVPEKIAGLLIFRNVQVKRKMKRILNRLPFRLIPFVRWNNWKMQENPEF